MRGSCLQAWPACPLLLPPAPPPGTHNTSGHHGTIHPHVGHIILRQPRLVLLIQIAQDLDNVPAAGGAAAAGGGQEGPLGSAVGTAGGCLRRQAVHRSGLPSRGPAGAGLPLVAHRLRRPLPLHAGGLALLRLQPLLQLVCVRRQWAGVRARAAASVCDAMCAATASCAAPRRAACPHWPWPVRSAVGDRAPASMLTRLWNSASVCSLSFMAPGGDWR